MLTGPGPIRVQKLSFHFSPKQHPLYPTEKWFPSVALLGFYTFFPSHYQLYSAFHCEMAATLRVVHLRTTVVRGFLLLWWHETLKNFLLFQLILNYIFITYPHSQCWIQRLGVTNAKCFLGFFDHSTCQLYQGKLYWRPDHTMKYPAPFWREKWYYSHRIIPSVFAYPSNAQEVHGPLLFFYFS